jgi:hypothetical protein
VQPPQRSTSRPTIDAVVHLGARGGVDRRYSTNRQLLEARRQSRNAFKHFVGTKMGFDRKLSTAEVAAAVERAFARQEGRESKSPTRTDNPVIGELASLDALLSWSVTRPRPGLESGSRRSTSWSRVGGRRRSTKMRRCRTGTSSRQPSSLMVQRSSITCDRSSAATSFFRKAPTSPRRRAAYEATNGRLCQELATAIAHWVPYDSRRDSRPQEVSQRKK